LWGRMRLERREAPMHPASLEPMSGMGPVQALSRAAINHTRRTETTRPIRSFPQIGVCG
jgi:hypothetical protein